MKFLIALLFPIAAHAVTYTHCNLTKQILHEDAKWDEVNYRMFATTWSCEGVQIVGGWVEYSRASVAALANAHNSTIEADGPYSAMVRTIDGVRVDSWDETAEIPAQHQQTKLGKHETLVIAGSPLVDLIVAKRAHSGRMKPANGALELSGADGLTFWLYSPQLHDFSVETQGDLAKQMVEAMIRAGISFRKFERTGYGHKRMVTQFSILNSKRQTYEMCEKSVSATETRYECELAPEEYAIKTE